MITRDLHTHTVYCDGKNTPEEMVLAAIEKGLTAIGFSSHSYAPYDLDCCMTAENTERYKSDIAALREKYRDKIEILCGIEQDIFSPASTEGYDYVIGSVHYLPTPEGYVTVDYTPEILTNLCRDHFGGDWYSLCEAYYGLVSRVYEETKCHIIGHLDLVTKFNEKCHLFDESHPRYIAAWQSAVDALLPCNIPFEVNTGAIARGWRTTPYPSRDIVRYIRSHGGRLILSSDSHSAATLGYQFEEWEHLLGTNE